MKKVVRFAKTNIIINISVLNQYDHIFVFLLFFSIFISLFHSFLHYLLYYKDIFYITK